MSGGTEGLIKAALREPQRALIELDRLDCQESFYQFVQRAWPALEPARPFVGGWAVKAVCDSLQAVTEGKIQRLLINIPPGCTKSMTTSVFWPAWEWGPRRLQHHRFINASYDKRLATRDLVRCRDIICSEWFQARWPMELKEDQDEKTYYENTKTGWRVATSVGGALVGYRGNRVVVDDPHDVKRAESETQRDEALRWWTEVVPTRFNDPDVDALVLMMQRLHTNDLSGHTLKTEDHLWSKLILPMEFEPDRRCELPEIGFIDPRTEPGQLLCPERFSAKAVATLKHRMSSRSGSYAVAGQFQQRPVSREGGMFLSANTQYVDIVPGEATRRVRGWDLAATDDSSAAWTVGVKMSITPRGQIFIEDVVRFRGTPHEVERKIKQTAIADGYGVSISIPQDPGQSGKHQKSALASLLNGYDVHFSPETGDKEARAIPFSAQWEAGNVFIVRAAWNDPYTGEVCLFPNSDYKDQVDASTRAYSYLVGHQDDDLVGTTPGLLTE